MQFLLTLDRHKILLTSVHIVGHSLLMLGIKFVVKELFDDASFASPVGAQHHDSIVGLGVDELDSGTGAVGAVATAVVQ